MTMETGIDTFSYYYVLTPKQKSTMLKSVRELPGFRTEKDDYCENTYSYCSNAFASEGVRFWIHRQNGKLWGLLIVVHPALVLGGTDRSKLYQPKKKAEYQSINKKNLTVNISGDETKPLREYVDTIWRLAGKKGRPLYGAREGQLERPYGIMPKNEKLHRLIEWAQKVEFDEGIREMILSYNADGC